MKRIKCVAGAEALILGILLGLSAVGCVSTAFHLGPLTWQVFSICAGMTLTGVVCLSFCKGGGILLGLLSLLGGFLWQNGALADQTATLLYRITRFYDTAYGIGYLALPGFTPGGPVLLPMAFWAGAIGILTTRTVCRGKGMGAPLILCLVSLLACLVVTDTPPDIWPLALLLGGLLLLLLTQAVRRKSMARGAALTGLLAVPVAAAMALLFLFVPKSGYHGQENAQNIQNSAISMGKLLENLMVNGDLNLGLGTDGNRVALDALSPMAKLDFPVAYVTAQRGGPLYLRSRDYDTYTGESWQASPWTRQLFAGASSQLLDALGTVTVRTIGVWKQRLIPYSPWENVEFTDGRILNPEGLGEYTWERVSSPGQSGWLGNDATEYVLKKCLELPEGTLRWLQEYTPLIPRSDADSPEARAAMIGDFVRSSATYDLQTPKMPAGAGDFARWFLEESDSGYCVHFATAAVVLLRAAGIPARYVEGYLVDAEAGEETPVMSGDAHAWAEYYVDGLGWLLLDPTPSTANAPLPVWTPSTEAPTEAPTVSATKPTTPAREPAAPRDDGKAADFSRIWTVLRWILGVLAAGAVIIGQWRLRLARKRRKETSLNSQALKLWRQVEQIAVCLGQLPPAPLKELAEKARFSPHALTKDELALFDLWLTDAIGRLRRRPLPVRLYHRLILALY